MANPPQGHRLEQLQKVQSPPDKKPPTFNVQRLASKILSYVLVGLSGFIIAWYSAKIDSTEKEAIFKTETKMQLERQKEEIDKLTRSKENKEETEHNWPDISYELTTEGHIGSIGNIVDKEIRTSYGVKYFNDLHICEINTSFRGWEKIELIPPLGCFFEIKNAVGNYKTWVMVIGSFTDLKHPVRAMIVSPVVSELLVPNKISILISGKIRRMTKEEVLQNKECITTLKKYNLDISEVF